MKVCKKTLLVVSTATLLLIMMTTIIALKKQRIRRFKIRPINRNRNKEGVMATLIRDMKTLETDHQQFFKYTRMTPNLFSDLLAKVTPFIQKDKKKSHLSPEHRLMMTIHYLAEGSSMQEIAWNYRVGKATVSNIIEETCKVIWCVLAPAYLELPSSEKWDEVSNEFFKRWNIPNCIGAVDGKHIVIQALEHSGSVFLNYKKSFSLVLMASCDAYYRFIFVDIGAAGGNHDSTVFKNTNFGISLLNNQLGVPTAKMIPKTSIETDCFLVADAAFPLHKPIMRPYPGNNLSDKKKIFNYRLSRARRTIENSFGILSARWRILRRPLTTKLSTCEAIVQATVVLHNFLQSSEIDLQPFERRYCPTGYVDSMDREGNVYPGLWREEGFRLQSIANLGWTNSSRAAQTTRDILADYFVSREGWLPWQEDYVNRGGAPNLF